LGADVICEKPLVLNPWNLDQLEDIEKDTGKKIYNVLQLRYNDSLKELKNKYSDKKDIKVEIMYITPRGKWYNSSWKGDTKKSGGVATNIGIHLFDLLLWLFGSKKALKIFKRDSNTIEGNLMLERAKVHFILSVDPSHYMTDNSFKPNRYMIINTKRMDLNLGNLHSKTYEEILKGNGYRISDVREAIKLVYEIRNM